MTKTTYQPEYVDQVRRLAKLGLIDEEIAAFFGVTVRTLYRWQLAHDDFAEALRLGKEFPNERVKSSLYKSACGYEYVSEKIFSYQGKITRAKTVEHVPPNPTSIIFFLKNRLPGEFRDTRHGDSEDPELVDHDSDIP